MATHKVFFDGNGNELLFYINSEGLLYFEIGDKNDDGYYRGYIALDKDDIDDLIKEVVRLRGDM